MEQATRQRRAPIAPGQRFTRLTVVERGHRDERSRLWWLVRCVCGPTLLVRDDKLKSGHTQSCGCLTRDVKHGHAVGETRSPEHRCWTNMLSRCRNPRHRSFPDYGGRGIGVCERWLSFENFLADVGYRPSPGLSIERVNNERGYELGNVVWATRLDQQRNTRKTSLVTVADHTMSLSEACAAAGIIKATVYSRLRRGWGIEDALTKRTTA